MQSLQSPQSRQNSGFTLLEIMLVVMIIALLAGSAIYMMRGNVDHTRSVRAETDVQNLMTQLQMYEVMTGGYPTSEQGVRALVEQPTGEAQRRKWRQILTKEPLDPWNNPFHIRNPATMSKDRIDLFSAGPDGKPNTADDVGNW